MSKKNDPYGLEELAARQKAARLMGGEQKINRQHDRGRLSVHERIDLLLDDGSFDEMGLLSHSDLPEVRDVTPADGKVTGYGRIDMREVYLGADDATVLAGSGGRVGMAKAFKNKAYAIDKGPPVLNLGDAGDARLPDIMGSAGLMRMSWPIDHAPRDRRVPMVAAILGECIDDPESRLDAVYDVVSETPRQSYDMHGLLEMLADEGSILELKPDFDGALITALVRIDGHVTGVLANNPMKTAGAMGTGACEKATSFICLCDSFHIPLLFLHDTPGFLLSKEAEEKKVAVHIMRFIEALHHSTVPRLSVIIRKSYGMAHFNMSGARMLSDQILAWPMADVSFMAAEVAVNVTYGRKLAASENAEQEKQAYIDEMEKGNTPWEPAGLNMIDKVIDPRDTRREIIRAFRRARGADGKAGMSQRLMAAWPKMC